MKIGVIVYPGTNGDHDVIHACRAQCGAQVRQVWHSETSLGEVDAVVVPGGFAHGDYLRTGALAKLSPITEALRRFARAGGPVLGICNGFQILCESGLLPGVLLPNVGMKFLSQFVYVRVENPSTPFTGAYKKSDIICCPIAHGEGNYYLDQVSLKRLEGEGQVVFRYCDKDGKVNPDSRQTNPNGAVNAIAGVCNQKRNVVGLMPHPERAAEALVGWIGGEVGRKVFELPQAAR